MYVLSRASCPFRALAMRQGKCAYAVCAGLVLLDANKGIDSESGAAMSQLSTAAASGLLTLLTRCRVVRVVTNKMHVASAHAAAARQKVAVGIIAELVRACLHLHLQTTTRAVDCCGLYFVGTRPPTMPDDATGMLVLRLCARACVYQCCA